jgi:ABC-2 type transport system ATP-binding protein
LAVALLGDPKVLVLDEPANGLDPHGIRWLRQTVRRVAADGNAVLGRVTCWARWPQMADDVIVIDHGRLRTRAASPT